MPFIKVGLRSSFVLKISIISNCRLRMCVVAELFTLFTRSFPLSLHTSRNALSRIFFTLELIFLSWNIHTSGLYLNCELVKASISNFDLTGSMYLKRRASACSFWLGFLHKSLTCFVKFNLYQK